MIDLHTHLLPGIDDGAESMEEAVQMIKEGREIGITAICATPHLSTNFKKTKTEKVMEIFLKLQERMAQEKIDIQLYLGSEIDLREDLSSMKDLPCFFLNHTQKYLFLELPLGEFPFFTERILFSLLIEGLSPILAHPERSLNQEIDFERLEKLKDSGILIQLNAGSLLGSFGRKVQKSALRLLEKDLVDLLASDAHDSNNRPITILAEAFRRIKNDFGEEKARELFEENPKKILQAEDIERKMRIKYF
jgi:protein-tyrosine phosphatase